jgi:hypothetical protein
MTVNISGLFGWKRIQKIGTSKFGVTKNPAARNTKLAVSILAAYDVVPEIDGLRPEQNIERAMDTFLLKRTQILQ